MASGYAHLSNLKNAVCSSARVSPRWRRPGALSGVTASRVVQGTRRSITTCTKSSAQATPIQSGEEQRLTIVRPDDWHLHARDDATLKAVIPHTAKVFGRAIIMPNLVPPITTVDQAVGYRERIMQAVPEGSHFKPMMTLYLTEATTPADVEAAVKSGVVSAFKLYPSGATTNSDAGVKNIDNCIDTLSAMAELGLPLLVHGEVVDPGVDIFDREREFLDQKLGPLKAKLPSLHIVMEHATTEEAVNFVLAHDNMGCTITPQHLLFNRNAMLVGGIRPHLYCLPILKREKHRAALVRAATSGNTKFFLGTDSAPHAKNRKECACGCAGVFSAHAALPLYAHVFDQAGALDKLEGFASLNGPLFYRMRPNTDTVTLVKRDWQVPSEYDLGADNTIVPLWAGDVLPWQME